MAMRQPIDAYCRVNAPTWHPMSFLTKMLYPKEEWPYHCCLARMDGVQVVASVLDQGALQIIHVSVAPVHAWRPDLSEGELNGYLLAEAPGILGELFGGRAFARQPDDPRKPDVKHYFSVLDDKEDAVGRVHQG